MAVTDRPTTITIRTSTRQLLESMKRPGESYDELIRELAEEYYPTPGHRRTEATLAANDRGILDRDVLESIDLGA